MNHPEIQPPKKLVRDSRRGKWIPFHGIYCITGEVCAQVRMLIIIIIVKNQIIILDSGSGAHSTPWLRVTAERNKRHTPIYFR